MTASIAKRVLEFFPVALTTALILYLLAMAKAETLLPSTYLMRKMAGSVTKVL